MVQINLRVLHAMLQSYHKLLLNMHLIQAVIITASRLVISIIHTIHLTRFLVLFGRLLITLKVILLKSTVKLLILLRSSLMLFMTKLLLVLNHLVSDSLRVWEQLPLDVTVPTDTKQNVLGQSSPQWGDEKGENYVHFTTQRIS